MTPTRVFVFGLFFVVGRLISFVYKKTKLRFTDRGIIRSLWGCSFMVWAYLASLGALGVVLLIWDNRVVELVEESVENFSVACSFKNVEDEWMWAFTGDYGPNLDRERSLLWEELAGLYYLCDMPWCMC